MVWDTSFIYIRSIKSVFDPTFHSLQNRPQTERHNFLMNSTVILYFGMEKIT